MIDVLVTIGMLGGGLGLFMVAVSMITDGLKQAAGSSLQELLSRWTSTPFKGIVGGMSLTAVIQSSSAATVITISFVNAGLINLYQALGIVFGANIGTTMTGWIVAVIGFEIKVASFALPLIGVGALLKLIGESGKRSSIGTALVGFGLFFIGIGFLKDAFSGIASEIDLNQFTVQGISGIVVYLVIGFLMTLLTQSSSAAIAITLTAASGGVLGMYAAAVMVIGANIGTTSTAIFASIGATANARRVASAHVIFNVVTGVIALLILPILFWLINLASEKLELQMTPAFILALFHTIFNVLGVIVMWPMASRLASFLEGHFTTPQESQARPKYLDKNTLSSPAVAIHCLLLEMTRLNTIVRCMAQDALSTESTPGSAAESEYATVRALSDAIADYINQLGRITLLTDDINQLSRLLRCQQHLLACANQANTIAIEQAKVVEIKNTEIAKGLANYLSEVAKFMDLAKPEDNTFSMSDCDTQLEQVQQNYSRIKTELTRTGTVLHIPVNRIIDIIDQNSRIRRMALQEIKALHLLHEISAHMEIKSTESKKASDSLINPG